WRIVKVATTKAQRKLFFNLRKSKKRLGWMSAAERTAVAKDLNVSEREVLEMESRLSGRDVGFDAPANASDDDHAPPAPINYLVDHNDDPALSYERSNHEDGQLELLREGMSELDPRSRDIIKRRFLGEPKATLQELADEYGVSAERVRQIEANALKKMRALFAA
ncbi:MAG: sigma-70 family RNA polymerase sigma factor, partial [Arenimonas sp.]